MTGYQPEDLTADEIRSQEELFRPFTQAVRELVDVTIRSTVDEDEIRRAQLEIEQITERLRKSEMPVSYGARLSPNGRVRHWGNAVIGLRNPVAPPLLTHRNPNGSVWSEFHLGAAYEGPPTFVHGGVSAMILDELLGEAASAGGKPGMTGTLTLVYRKPTPLGDLRGESWIERSEGIKTWAKGHIIGPDGVTVEAEGVFILPRWARAALAQDPTAPTPDAFE